MWREQDYFNSCDNYGQVNDGAKAGRKANTILLLNTESLIDLNMQLRLTKTEVQNIADFSIKYPIRVL